MAQGAGEEVHLCLHPKSLPPFQVLIPVSDFASSLFLLFLLPSADLSASVSAFLCLSTLLSVSHVPPSVSVSPFLSAPCLFNTSSRDFAPTTATPQALETRRKAPRVLPQQLGCRGDVIPAPPFVVSMDCVFS